MKECIIPAAESTGVMHITDIDALQAHLLRLSDMAASGACLPQIIHELNSPLSSIRANAANSVHALASLRQDFQDIFPQLTSEQQALFWAMVERAWQYAHHLSTSEERKLSRALETELETCHVNNAEEVAETLVEMGMYEEIAPLLPLLHSPHCGRILQAAYNLASLHYGTRGIHTALDRISHLIATLKQLVFSASVAENRSDAAISDGIEAAFTLYHALKLTKNIQIAKQYDPLPAIPCQPAKLIQVWKNLLRNAIDAIEGKSGTLAVHAAQQQNEIVVAITDSGHGIPPEIHRRVFEPFFTTKPDPGAGLGLYVARRIIEEHRGSIAIESQPGRTTVTVRLPIA